MRKVKQQAGFLNLPNDNIVKTIAVALLLCLACSVVVSTAATLLKPTQVANKLLDKKKNIVAVAGLDQEGVSIAQAFEQIDTRVVDLATGEYSDAVDALNYDQRKASKDAAMSVSLNADQDVAGIGRRANLANVYLLQKEGQLDKIILPVKGKGLWSTMYGFIALEADATTVSGVTFYEHGETPGLGGEIENKRWQKSWIGKQVASENGETKLHVIKGMVNEATSESEYKIDGLAGATLTSNGVSNLITFWMGENGFGPYLAKLRQANSAAVPSDANTLVSKSSVVAKNAEVNYGQ